MPFIDGGDRNAVGRRSFGPTLLLAGLVTLAPIVGDIPGVPVLIRWFALGGLMWLLVLLALTPVDYLTR